MNKILKTYAPFTRAGILEAVAYRANFISFCLGEILYCFIMYFVWKAVFESSKSPQFMGFTMTNMVVYLFMIYLTQFLSYSDSSYPVGEDIVEGSIAMRVIKPISYGISLLFAELGNKIINIAIMFVPVILGVEIYRYAVTGSVQFSVVNFLMYTLSLVFAYIISFYFNLCFGYTAFFLKNLWGSNLLKGVIVSFLSGAIIPLAFMPETVMNVLKLLPFASLSYTPVMFYMGMYKGLDILYYFGIQIFWVIFMWAFAKLVWRIAIRHVTVQGG